MIDETSDLSLQQEDEYQQAKKAFEDYCEQCAAHLEITVDYFIAEFL